jgi:hypothetical protein
VHPRFRVVETPTLYDGSKRYRVVDLVEGGSASKHGVLKVRVEAEAACSLLNAEHPRQSGVARTSLSICSMISKRQALDGFLSVKNAL